MAEAKAIAEFRVTGMSCQGCVRHVTEAVQALPGVATVTVGLQESRATVRWRPGAEPDPAAVLRAVQEAGYRAEALSSGAPAKRNGGWSPLEGWRLNVVLGAAVTVPLLAGDWLFQWAMSPWFQWVAFALALPVQAVCGARFYRGAWNQLRVRSANMDTLVALGSTTAFAYSGWALLAGWHTHLYFPESAAIITLVSVGHWLEAKASERAAGALRALLTLAPQTARRLDAHGVEAEAPAGELERDDRVVLRPGDCVPIDGEVLEGQSAVDEAMLTGESLPTEKGPGALVYAGTVNQNGRLVIRVSATGEATALAQIIAVVQRAQSSRADIQRLGDRVSSVFVPVVVLVALATALWWGLAHDQALAFAHWLAPWLGGHAALLTPGSAAVVHAAAVLIVACPCAMGLATPVAIMAGANAAARRGILIRDALALEKTGRLTAVVFDKTGTLTEGRVTVAAIEDLRPLGGWSVGLEALAAGLAAPSSHPLSRALAKAGGAAGAPELRSWREVRGAGVTATLPPLSAAPLNEPPTLRLGSLLWLREAGVDLDRSQEFVSRWTGQGATLLGLAMDQELLGLFALRDTLKPHAPELVAQLLEQGKKPYLASGDNPLTVAAIARQAGIPLSHVFAGLRPEQKAELIRRLQQEGQRVAFVGDGINDAPALAQADLGIAVSRASDVAREAADIILLRSDIGAIPEALLLAQATLRTIKQNLFWAFFYNAAAVPLAALGFLSPILCAAAMGLSDLLVIGNALRLRHVRQSV